MTDLEKIKAGFDSAGVPSRVEKVEAAYFSYTAEETDPAVADLFGDVGDDREESEDTRSVLTAPAHTRLWVGTVYFVFTPGGKFVCVKATQEDGWVTPADMPE